MKMVAPGVSSNRLTMRCIKLRQQTEYTGIFPGSKQLLWSTLARSSTRRSNQKFKVSSTRPRVLKLFSNKSTAALSFMNDVRRPSPIAPAAHYIHARIPLLKVISVLTLTVQNRFAVMTLKTRAVMTPASPALVTVLRLHMPETTMAMAIPKSTFAPVSLKRGLFHKQCKMVFLKSSWRTVSTLTPTTITEVCQRSRSHLASY